MTVAEAQSNTADLVALAVRDPLAFVEHRAEHGLPPVFEFDEVGDSIAGFVTDVEVVDGQFGRYQIVSIVRRDGTESRIKALGAVLSSRLAGVSVGDAVAIRRVEDAISKEFGSRYKVFEVSLVNSSPPDPPSVPAGASLAELAEVVDVDEF